MRLFWYKLSLRSLIYHVIEFCKIAINASYAFQVLKVLYSYDQNFQPLGKSFLQCSEKEEIIKLLNKKQLEYLYRQLVWVILGNPTITICYA